MLAGAGGLGGMAKSGGAGQVICPACQKPISIMQIKEDRTIACACCGEHKDGVALRREGSRTIVAFRSFRYWGEFRALNGAGGAGKSASAT